MCEQASTSANIEITVVVSCYNEAAFITDTIEHVIQALRVADHSYEIMVVDDVSRDDSVRRIRDYMETHPAYPITLVENKVNRGLANNYVEAAFLGRGKYYRLCCGDDSEAPEALVNIFKHIGVADIVVPYQDQDQVMGKSWTRRQLSKTFTFLVNRFSGYHLKYYNGMAIHLRYNVLRWKPKP